jgi:hypothetical protein
MELLNWISGSIKWVTINYNDVSMKYNTFMVEFQYRSPILNIVVNCYTVSCLWHPIHIKETSVNLK